MDTDMDDNSTMRDTTGDDILTTAKRGKRALSNGKTRRKTNWATQHQTRVYPHAQYLAQLKALRTRYHHMTQSGLIRVAVAYFHDKVTNADVSEYWQMDVEALNAEHVDGATRE